MPRYLFDVHDDGPAVWGDATEELADEAAIEDRVRELIAVAQARQAARNSIDALTTVFVHQDGDTIVLIASARSGEDVRFGWTPRWIELRSAQQDSAIGRPQ